LEIIKEVECSNEPNTVCHNFYEPRVHGKPVFARDASPAQFCREQGYGKSATVNKEYSYEGNGSLWNGSVWEINLNLAAIREVNCCKLEDKPSDICQTIQCPSGQAWDQTQNKCATVDQCAPIVTLKKGGDLTTIKNPQGEAFSTNTTCANKNISLSPCNTTMGVVADGTSPSGNKLYKWPKTASGLSKDYNLVEINGQCWFADNLEEKPSSVPTSGVNDNLSPHNFYGYYDYVGT